MREFLNREKFYSYLLVAAFFLHAFSVLFLQSGVIISGEKYISPAEAKIREYRKNYKTDKSREEKIREFINSGGPGVYAAVFFILITWILLFIFFLSLFWLLITVVFKRAFFKRLMNLPPPSWGLGDVFKLFVILYFYSVLGGIALLSFRNFLVANKCENLASLVYTAFMNFIVILFFLRVVKRKYKLRDLGITVKNFFKDFIVGISVYSLFLPFFIALVFALNAIVDYFSYSPPPHPIVDVFVVESGRSNDNILWFSVILACTLGPIAEEFFFRAFLYPAIKQKYGKFYGLFFSSLIFASVHYSFFAFMPVFFLGFLLAYLYDKRGSLIPSIVIHIFHNSLFIGYFFVLKSVFM